MDILCVGELYSMLVIRDYNLIQRIEFEEFAFK